MDKSVTAVLTSAARTLQRRFEATANNIANLSTDGFRGQRSITSEHVASTGGASISMPRLGSALTLMRPGEVVPTQRSLDFAIEGPGFFLLETPEGGQVLSRAGAFSLDADGSLVASDGARVLDAGGAPIAIPPGSGSLNAASDGTLERDGAILGQIAIIAAPERPERLGAGRLAAPNEIVPVETQRLRQGALEQSNLSGVSEIASMIEASRLHALVADLAETEDRRIRNVIETFSRQT